MNTIRQISFTTVIKSMQVTIVANYDPTEPSGHEVISATNPDGTRIMVLNKDAWDELLLAKIQEEGSAQDYDMWRERRSAIDEDHAYDIMSLRDD